MSATPPLLAIAEGRRPRLRGAPAIRPKELQLHMAVASLLRRHCRPDWRWAHYPAGERRDPRTAAKLRAMGLRAGLPDFILFSPDSGRLHGLELKRSGEHLSEDQVTFAAWCEARGVPHAVARTMDEALTALNQWGCLRNSAQIAGRPS